jgi:hypothetical protein
MIGSTSLPEFDQDEPILAGPALPLVRGPRGGRRRGRTLGRLERFPAPRLGHESYCHLAHPELPQSAECLKLYPNDK